MKAIYGLYSTPESAQNAFETLRSEGIAAEKITVMSSEPLEEYEFGRQNRNTVLPWLAALGALIGFASAYTLTSWTQQAWPINTGGMAIVTRMTNIIILFELTMLGAILATVITLMVTARIPQRLPAFYDEEISDGKILIGVAEPEPSAVDAVRRALLSGPAESLKRIT
jgi:Protein of unknown function (DUF3341)